jgi:hypothetical protein
VDDWLPFDGTPYEPRPDVPGDHIEEAALAFHHDNPHILEEIVRVCLIVQRRGRRHWSINGAFEVVRYNGEVTTTGRTYKLNNNHRSCYARWIMRDWPQLAEFFTTRAVARVPQDDDVDDEE